MRKGWPIWLSALLIPTAFAFLCYAQIEAYCFFYPGIDTQYAPGFSEAAFSQVSTGMTVQAVQQKLGAPLYIQTTGNGSQLWFYTLDAKCKWGDWAWLVRQVVFSNGTAVEVVKQVHYD